LTGLLQLPENESANYLVTTVTGANRWKVNSYIVTAKKTGKNMLIDAGGEPSELVAVLAQMADIVIEFILLTHGHFDHLSSAAALCAAYNLPCLVHRGDMKLARHAPFYAASFDGSAVTVPKPLVPLEPSGSGCWSEWGITVVETPGHTAGSCCYLMDKFVFTGDTLINGAIGRTDQPGSDPAALIESVATLLAQAPDDGVIFPGHGRPWSVAAARPWWAINGDTPPRHTTFL
jgi:glyoxylase-like metal-dependent hydrolase (beta-lactamase superfamily II)